MYLLRVKGTIPYNMDEENLYKFKAIIEARFPGIMNVTDDVVYISGDMKPDDLDKFQKLLINIYPTIIKDEEIIVKVKGDKIEDRTDFVINEHGIYLYHYQLTRKIEPEIIMKAE